MVSCSSTQCKSSQLSLPFSNSYYLEAQPATEAVQRHSGKCCTTQPIQNYMQMRQGAVMSAKTKKKVNSSL